MAFSLMPPPGQPASQGYTQRYCAREWEEQKPTIYKLYIEEGQKLKAVLKILSESGFLVTQKQVKDRLKKWGLTIKNVKENEMLAIARKRLKRKVLDKKESAFRVNKQPLTEKNIDRFLKRRKISDCTLLSMTSPINAPSPAFSVYTPHPPNPDSPCNLLSPIAASPFCIVESSSTFHIERQPSAPTSPAPTSLQLQRTYTPFTGQSPVPFQSTNFLLRITSDAFDSAGSDAASQPLREASSAEISSRSSSKGLAHPGDMFILDTFAQEESHMRHAFEDPSVPNQGLRCYQAEDDCCRNKLEALESQYEPDHLEVLAEGNNWP